MHAVVHESHRARRGRLAEAEVQESPAREEHLAFNVVEQVGDEAAWDATLAILAGGQDPLQLRLGHQLLLSALHFVVVLLVRALGASDRVLAGEGHLVHFLGFAARAIRLLLVSLQNSIPVLLALLVLVETRHVDVECPARPPDAGLHAARHVRLNGVFEEEGAEGAPEHGQLRPETTREGILGGAVRDGDDHSFAVAAHGELLEALQRVEDVLLLILGHLALGTVAVALDIAQTEAMEIVVPARIDGGRDFKRGKSLVLVGVREECTSLGLEKFRLIELRLSIRVAVNIGVRTRYGVLRAAGLGLSICAVA